MELNLQIKNDYTMITIISPSKTLGYIKNRNLSKVTIPQFIDSSEELVSILRGFTVNELKSLFSVSEKIAQLNYGRFRDWHTPFDSSNSKPAILTFKGDVYEGLDAAAFNRSDFEFAQQSLLILSGLYGVLRPLDLMQPYRLEMGTKLEVGDRNNLYEFWSENITAALNNQLLNSKNPVLVNLASQEYFKAINSKNIKGTIVTPVFKEQKGSDFKVVAIYAKRARGLMSKFIIQNKIGDAEQLKEFNWEGYYFRSDMSTKTKLVFVR